MSGKMKNKKPEQLKESALSYYLPEPAKSHTVLHIPGSHTLYVGPSSCTRRHAIEAEEHGDRRDVSFLYVTEADVVSGDYDEVIGDAIADLIEIVEPSPHIFLIAVFCIDDFLGTDEDALIQGLEERFEGRQFTMVHIDPVTLGESKKKGVMKKKGNMFRFIKPAEKKDDGVLLMGNYVDFDSECEFPKMLGDCGVGSIREIRNCETYEEYQDIGKSRMVIGMRFAPENMIGFLEKKLSIPHYYFTACYDVDYIAKGYGDISEKLTGTRQDWSREAAETREYAKATAALLNGRSVAIDSEASIMVFAAARALLGYGFNVTQVLVSRNLFPFDEEARQLLLEEHPELEVIRSDDYTEVTGEKRDVYLAIGADCIRMMNHQCHVDIWHDEGFFGFQGVRKLMDVIRESIGEGGAK